MKIIFGLGWAESPSKNYLKVFKDNSAAELFEKYRSRIQHDFSCEAQPMSFEALKAQAGLIWICERSKTCLPLSAGRPAQGRKNQTLSSEDLAICFQKICGGGVKNLTVWIGGPDGLSSDELTSIQADLIWSFGPLTLPHELAAVVASEQIYRAISILKNHPYHSGH